jgi:hypothetical protein
MDYSAAGASNGGGAGSSTGAISGSASSANASGIALKVSIAIITNNNFFIYFSQTFINII